MSFDQALRLLDLLAEKGVHVQIAHAPAGALLFSATVVGARLEFECRTDGILYRYYFGSEDIFDDMDELRTFLES